MPSDDEDNDGQLIVVPIIGEDYVAKLDLLDLTFSVYLDHQLAKVSVHQATIWAKAHATGEWKVDFRNIYFAKKSDAALFIISQSEIFNK